MSLEAQLVENSNDHDEHIGHDKDQGAHSGPESIMRGWFDAFRENGGPTLYSYSNRTSVLGDVTTITLCVVFATLYLAFFIIFPGVRRERFTTFLSVTLSLFIGTAILLGNSGSGWHVGETAVSSAYKAFSSEKIMGRVGVYIGLSHVNVTLVAMPIYYNDSNMDVNFNERFQFERPTQLQEEYRKALIKGLPFPILSVAEYLAVDAEGFSWGRSYRQAGYYTSIFLWTAFVLWMTMNMLMVVVPRYGAYTMAATGAVMLFADALFVALLPQRDLVVHIEDAVLTMHLGWCFYLILIAGLLSLMVGLAISVIDLIYPHKFSTILEMNYGTPFDRHTIIEDSHETKKKKKTVPRLEEPNTVGIGGLLRRLSKRDRDRPQHAMQMQENYGYESETSPKSPWQMMFRSEGSRKGKMPLKKAANRLELPPNSLDHSMMIANAGYLHRTDSKESEMSSSTFSGAVFNNPPNVEVLKKVRRTDSGGSSNSSLASFGLSLLTRNKKNKGQVMQLRQHPNLANTDSDASRGFSVHAENNENESNNGHVEPDVSVVVGARKNSTTRAVRRNSREQPPNDGSELAKEGTSSSPTDAGLY